MSKYEPLWDFISNRDEDDLTLTFADIENIVGVPLNHSFLTAKKELTTYGFAVGKISMKAQTVTFKKIK